MNRQLLNKFTTHGCNERRSWSPLQARQFHEIGALFHQLYIGDISLVDNTLIPAEHACLSGTADAQVRDTFF